MSIFVLSLNITLVILNVALIMQTSIHDTESLIRFTISLALSLFGLIGHVVYLVRRVVRDVFKFREMSN